MARDPDIKGLRDFFREGDKNSPQFFAGRREIILEVEATVNELRNDVNRLPISDVHPKQQTWLIQGAPGAGKTALQWYLRDRWLADKDGPVVVDVVLGELSDRQQLTSRIADRMLPNGAERLMTERAVSHTAGVESKVTFSRTKSQSVQRSPLVPSDLARLYKKSKLHWLRRFLPFVCRKTAEPRPIVLIIDEIQAMNSIAGEVLHDLHVGVQGVPIVLLLAGLAWSSERLKEAGVSRFVSGNLNHVQTLGPLQPQEAAESVKLMLEEYYVTGKETEDIARWIAKLSDGWPQHLRHYMRALAGDLAAKRGNLSEVSRDWIQAEGDAKRQSYYLDRLQGTRIVRRKGVLAEVARFIGDDGCLYNELEDMLESRRWQHEMASADVMPKNMEPSEFIQELIRSGIAHSMGARVTIPIPSFRRFLIEYNTRKDI